MAVTLAEVASYRQLLAQIQGDLKLSVGEVARGVNSRNLASALTTVVDPYLELGSMTAATFYDEQRAAQGLEGTYTAETLAGSEAERLDSLAGWGLSGAGGTQAATIDAISKLLIGGAVRLLTERINDTTLGNMERDALATGVKIRYQRVPRANCCGFCGMLASRGAVYTSQSTAGTVVGRGVPITPPGEKRKRGGQGKGIKPRGSQRLGETYHDNCYCTVVMVKDGEPVELFPTANEAQGKWAQIYESARVGVEGDIKPHATTRRSPDGSLHTQWAWEDGDGNVFKSDGVTNRIINGMRREKYALDKTGDF